MKTTKLTCLIALLLTSLLPASAQVKRLYLANDDHTDYMWTANEAQYDTAFVQMLDYYLDQIDSTQSNPDDFQARFNLDGSYWISRYRQFRSPAQFQRLIDRLRSGHLSSPLTTLVSTYGGQPTEAVLRGMYSAGKLERQWNLRFRLAVCMENQTLPLGLSSLWAGSGAKFSWRGVCACASQIPNARLAQRRHQLYHYMGPDLRGVTMKWYNLPGDNTGLGGYSETRQQHKPTDVAANLTKTLTDLTALCDTVSPRSAYPFNAAAAFGYGWDDLSTFVSPAFVTAAQTHSTPARRVRVSNEEDFFKDVERNYPRLPTESVSYGNEWDLYPVSMNETTAQVRRATEKLRSAEALASLVSLKDSTFANDLTTARDRAWEAYGLYWEHDWTADGPVSRQARADWQVKLGHQIGGYVDTLQRRAATALGQQIKATRQPRFYVFNALNWPRSDVADVAFLGKGSVKVIDLRTNAEVPSQVIQKGGQPFLRIWAENVPSVGYAVYEIRSGRERSGRERSGRERSGNPARQPVAARVKGEFIQNNYYRLRLRKSGVISELYDRRAGNRQLVQPTNGRLLNDLGSVNVDSGSPVLVENSGPVSVTLKAVSNDPIAHTVRVTLFRNSPRIDIEDSLQANFADVKTWAFSLNLTKPTTQHEELGAVLKAKKETRGGHYASQNARYDWLTFNHFADLSEPGYGVTLSNQDCSFFKLGQSTPDSLWEGSAQLNALAGGQVDGPKLGIVAQNGATAFRYQFALTTHTAAFDAVAAMKFSLEHQNPLVTGAVSGSREIYPSITHSLLRPSDPSVLLWSLKPNEDGIGKGLVARFWNLKNTGGTSAEPGGTHPSGLANDAFGNRRTGASAPEGATAGEFCPLPNQHVSA
ncbi:MAG: glycoside hydrolase [Cytophagaceae bacterium]|nr:glycoside hydrolase [Cytophagaceae bacterium]